MKKGVWGARPKQKRGGSKKRTVFVYGERTDTTAGRSGGVISEG